MSTTTLWDKCLDYLRSEISPQQFNTWIRPLHVIEKNDTIQLLAPNRFVLDWINDRFLIRIKELMEEITSSPPRITLQIGSKTNVQPAPMQPVNKAVPKPVRAPVQRTVTAEPRGLVLTKSNLNPNFTFENFVEGKSNQLARAAAIQVSENAGKAYNPLFLYGGVGLGKTHIMHAMGNFILKQTPDAKILYLHSERFVADMIRALQRNAMNEFKRYYRSLNALLIDDIQFFAGKERSQEEFFHTFNALLDGQQQIVLTCDRYPKEINGLEERLQSRFGFTGIFGYLLLQPHGLIA